ncbi:MAG TPA: hypothetical protein VIL60_10895 [Rhodanobacter sp.]
MGAVEPSLHGWLDADAAGGVGLLDVWLLSALISVLLAVAGLALRPANRRDVWYRDYLALLGIGLLMPVVGPLFMLLGILLFKRLAHRRDPAVATRLMTSAFVPEPPRQLGRFGVGGAVHGLKAGSLDTDKSIRALMLIEQRRSAQTSQLLFDTLGHPDESVRLTAAGLLDRRESRLLQLLRQVERAIKGAGPTEVRRVARLHLEAAQLSAEMLYQRLAREGMVRLYVERWGLHLDEAQPLCGEQPNWLICKARWLSHNQLPGSLDLYQRALEAGAAPASVMPYLAEHCWHQRDYSHLRELAATGDMFGGLPVAGAIRRRWAAKT